MATRHDETWYEKNISIYYFLVCKRRLNDDVGVEMCTVFQKFRPGAGFKTGDLVNSWVGCHRITKLPKQPAGHPMSAPKYNGPNIILLDMQNATPR